MQYLSVRGQLRESCHSSWWTSPSYQRLSRAALLTASHLLCSALFSPAPAIVVGADKYLLFPALAVKRVGGERDLLWDVAIVMGWLGGGSETQTSGILSSQPEAQYTVSSALRRIHRWLELPGCFRGGELGRAQIGDTERLGGLLLKRRVEFPFESCLHGRPPAELQNNTAKRSQGPLRAGSHWCYGHIVPQVSSPS